MSEPISWDDRKKQFAQRAFQRTEYENDWAPQKAPDPCPRCGWVAFGADGVCEHCGWNSPKEGTEG